jgi:hypothetical protein
LFFPRFHVLMSISICQFNMSASISVESSPADNFWKYNSILQNTSNQTIKASCVLKIQVIHYYAHILCWFTTTTYRVFLFINQLLSALLQSRASRLQCYCICILSIKLSRFTDEQVFYDKFLCDKFYLPSARVYMQQILYDKFSYDKFYLLVWTCQKKVFIAAMTEKL